MPHKRQSLHFVPGMTRLKYDESGVATLRYTAIDPATKLFTCNCGKPNCNIKSFRPLREHIAELVRVILSAGHAGQLPGAEDAYEAWPGVCYPLQMAASIEDVFADPSITDDSDSWAWCSPAWESDEEDREQASKYVAGLTIFNFVWMAYEDAIRESSITQYRKDKLPVQARKHFADHADRAEDMPLLAFSYRLARHCCLEDDVLTDDIGKIEETYGLKGASAAAELVRIFRNYIIHGSDPIPIYHLPGGWAFARFYAMSRLLLLLIQTLVKLQLPRPDAQIPMSRTFDQVTEPAGAIFKNLHLQPQLWRTSSSLDD